VLSVVHRGLAALLFTLAPHFFAADPFDWQEHLGRVYANDANPVIQEAWLLGRYHGQWHWADGSAGEDDDYEGRRYRMGGQARLFQRLTVHAQMVSGSDFEPFYNGFTELWAAWRFNDALILTVGQQKHRFTHDRNVSSRYINYLERSMLTNLFGADRYALRTDAPLELVRRCFLQQDRAGYGGCLHESGFGILGARYRDSRFDGTPRNRRCIPEFFFRAQRRKREGDQPQPV